MFALLPTGAGDCIWSGLASPRGAGGVGVVALAAAAKSGPVGAGAREGALAVLLRVFMLDPAIAKSGGGGSVALLSSMLLVLLGLQGGLRATTAKSWACNCIVVSRASAAMLVSRGTAPLGASPKRDDHLE